MPDNVQWSVKDVDGNIAQPGVISATGEYTAPSVDELPDGFVAVMVTAEGTLDGNAVKSSALVSVLNSTIVTNPLYDSCESGAKLTLSGQSLAQTELQWTILTPQWESTLQIDPEDSNRRIYTAGKNMDKDVPYPIDKIEIKDPVTGAVSYISVRIVKALTVAPMVLGDLSDLPNGKAHFQLQGRKGLLFLSRESRFPGTSLQVLVISMLKRVSTLSRTRLNQANSWCCLALQVLPGGDESAWTYRPSIAAQSLCGNDSGGGFHTPQRF